MRLDEEQHLDDHWWVRDKRRKEAEWLTQLKHVMWAVITTLATGAVVSLIGVLWWAMSQFIKNGGAS